MFERKKKRIPGLNTTATADISFMLLVFFLVVSSMDTDKGLSRQLPPPTDEKQEQEQLVKERNVLNLVIDAHDRLTCNGDTIGMDDLTDRVADFVANDRNASDKPEKSVREVHLFGRCQVSDRHILSLQVSRKTSYDAYFQMQNAVVAAYMRLRNQKAQQRFNRCYAQCTPEQRRSIDMIYPQRISESQPTEEGGAQ